MVSARRRHEHAAVQNGMVAIRHMTPSSAALYGLIFEISKKTTPSNPSDIGKKMDGKNIVQGFRRSFCVPGSAAPRLSQAPLSILALGAFDGRNDVPGLNFFAADFFALCLLRPRENRAGHASTVD